MTKRAPYLRLCITLLFAALAMGLDTNATAADTREAEVYTTDGRSFTGRVVSQDKTQITLDVAGIHVPIPRGQIELIKYKLSTERQYLDRAAQLSQADKADPDARYRLIYWAYEQGDRDFVSRELDRLAQQFPSDSRFTQLKRVVEAQPKDPDQTDPTTPSLESQTDPTPDTASPNTSDPTQIGYTLTQEDINRIKVYEVELDRKPKVIIPNDVLQTVFNEFADRPGVPQDGREQLRFRNKPGYEQLELLFDLRARHLYGRVIQPEDPPVLQQFRADIHQRYVLSYCGTVNCHGAPQGQGHLTLIRAQPTADATAYTNFYRLQQTTVGDWGLIERQDPSRSLLLQYGLETTHAATPHPQVKGWRPHFRDKNDAYYQLIMGWIQQLWTPTPDYGVQAPTPDPQPDTPN